MKHLSIILLLFCLCRAFASIFPEDEEAWHRRIDAKIDKNRKSDVIIRVKVDPSKFGKISRFDPLLLSQEDHSN